LTTVVQQQQNDFNSGVRGLRNFFLIKFVKIY
jgi:hypothetical protein